MMDILEQFLSELDLCVQAGGDTSSHIAGVIGYLVRVNDSSLRELVPTLEAVATTLGFTGQEEQESNALPRAYTGEFALFCTSLTHCTYIQGIFVHKIITPF